MTLVRPSRRPLGGLLRMRFFLHPMTNLPHPEGAPSGRVSKDAQRACRAKLRAGTKSTANDRGRPIGGAASEPVVGRFAIVIDRFRRAGERGPVIEAIGVDDGAGTGRCLGDGAYINPAAPANQELGGARTETV